MSESWSDRLSPARLRALALGLAMGAAGGFVADWLDVPLAWMLGALFATMVARVSGAPIDVPIWLRAIFLILIGLFLGENFEGAQASDFLQWPISIVVAMLYVPVATACAFLFYRYAARQEKATALCSSIPGGLIAVVVMSGSLGADERQVALAQSLRIAIVVCMAPAVAFGLLGHPPPGEETFSGHALISLADLGILLPAALAVMWGMMRLRIPIPYMIGPLLASGVLRLTGVIEGVLPHQLIEVALVVTGSSIGTRFHGVSPGRLARFGLMTLGGTSVLMAVSALLAAVVAPLVGEDFLPVLLAYAPGGVAEMSLIALAIHANPGFVAIHHVVRIVFVMLVVPLMVAWGGRGRARSH